MDDDLVKWDEIEGEIEEICNASTRKPIEEAKLCTGCGLYLAVREGQCDLCYWANKGWEAAEKEMLNE